MSKHMSNNLRIKRKYLVWLKEAKGLSEQSIDKAASAIATYEAFIKKRISAPFMQNEYGDLNANYPPEQTNAPGPKYPKHPSMAFCES